MGWEDQGRQEHGWFGDGTSGNVPEAVPRPARADDLGRLVARDAAAHLSPRLRAEFEDFTGRDGGKTLLRAMRVWAEGSHLPPARFRALLVGQGMTEAGAASLQAMARGLANPHDPAALAGAGAQLAAALKGTVKGDLRFGLSYAQDKAVYAEVNGLVPPRPEADRPELERPAAMQAGTGAMAGAAGAVAGPMVVTVPTLTLPETLLTLLKVGGAAGSFVTFMFWPTPVGDGTLHRPSDTGTVPPPAHPLQGFPPLQPSQVRPDKDGSILFSKPSGDDGEKPKAGTHDRPPAGSKPID